jgi:hypothetical protein
MAAVYSNAESLVLDRFGDMLRSAPQCPGGASTAERER